MRKRAVAIALRKNKVLLMRRVKRGKEYYIFPGGDVMRHETPEEAVLRESMEEFGLEVEIDRHLFVMERSNANYDSEHYYLIKDLPGEPQICGEEKEFMAQYAQYDQYHLEWVHLEELSQMENFFPHDSRDRVLDALSMAVSELQAKGIEKSQPLC